MSKARTMEYAIVLFLVLLFATGCAFKKTTLKRELSHKLKSLPEPPNSVLLSEVWDYGGGSDSRCDGYLVSRLYGTEELIEGIVEFVEDEIIPQAKWSLDPRIRDDKTNINLISRDGYLLGVNTIELREELLRDPLFDHKEVTLDQPYKTVFLFNIVHIDSSQVNHCWGY